MGSKYTFQRPRKRSKQIQTSNVDTYPLLDDDESEKTLDEINRYTRYSFFVLFTLLIIILLCIGYISTKGLPTRVRV